MCICPYVHYKFWLKWSQWQTHWFVPSPLEVSDIFISEGFPSCVACPVAKSKCVCVCVLFEERERETDADWDSLLLVHEDWICSLWVISHLLFYIDKTETLRPCYRLCGTALRHGDALRQNANIIMVTWSQWASRKNHSYVKWCVPLIQENVLHSPMFSYFEFTRIHMKLFCCFFKSLVDYLFHSLEAILHNNINNNSQCSPCYWCWV